jgi:hypothetical protein
MTRSATASTTTATGRRTRTTSRRRLLAVWGPAPRPGPSRACPVRWWTPALPGHQRRMTRSAIASTTIATGPRTRTSSRRRRPAGSVRAPRRAARPARAVWPATPAHQGHPRQMTRRATAWTTTAAAKPMRTMSRHRHPAEWGLAPRPGRPPASVARWSTPALPAPRPRTTQRATGWTTTVTGRRTKITRPSRRAVVSGPVLRPARQAASAPLWSTVALRAPRPRTTQRATAWTTTAAARSMRTTSPSRRRAVSEHALPPARPPVSADRW